MKNRDFLFLLLSATVFFAFISYLLQLPANATTFQFVGGDAPSYWEASKLIYTEGVKPHPLRPFLYPFLIGLPSFCGVSSEISLWLVISGNCVCWLGTIAFIYKILKNNINNKAALIGSFIFVSNISNIIHCWTVLAESLFHFLIIGSLYFLLKYLSNKQNASTFIAFVTFLCTSFITRPTYSPLLLFIVPLFIWMIAKQYLNLFISVISIAIFCATVGFNAFKIKQYYGNWTLSYIGECTIYMYFGAYAKIASPQKTIEQMNKDYLVEMDKRSRETPRYNDSILWTSLKTTVKNDIVQQLSDNKIGLSIAFARNLWSNSSASSADVLYLKDFEQRIYFKPLIRVVFWWEKCQNMLNTMIALFIMPFLFYRFRNYYEQKKRTVFWLLLVNTIVSVYTILVSTISFSQGNRFHLVFLPLSIISLAFILNRKRL